MVLHGFACVCMYRKQALEAVFLFKKRLLKRYHSAFFVVCFTKCKNAFCFTKYTLLLYNALHLTHSSLQTLQTTKPSNDYL